MFSETVRVAGHELRVESGDIARQADGAIILSTGDTTLFAVVTAEIPSKWNMEGGSLLPEPGEEDEWLARHGA